jgi:hypothetical protein
MNKKYLIKGIVTTLIIFVLSGILYLYTAGYRVSRETEKPIDLAITGMINAKSIPEGATVYLDDKVISATDSTIAGISLGKHHLKIVKRGFMPWEKEVEVYPELVTDITAVLVAKNPRIEPLTQTGATNPSISPSLSAIAYFSKDPDKPGVWVLPLNGTRLNIFSSTPGVVLEDTAHTKFSEGLEIKWSPDETELLVKQAENKYYLVNLNDKSAKSTEEWETILEKWNKELTKKREALLAEAKLSKELKEIALQPETMWAPDGKKFLYKVERNNQIEYRVYDMEDPLPVGEKVDTLVMRTPTQNNQPKFSWFADSFHLITLERSTPADIKGVISLIRIDGTNKTEIYNNNVFSDEVFSAPSGDKIIALISFRTDTPADLYTISIR